MHNRCTVYAQMVLLVRCFDRLVFQAIELSRGSLIGGIFVVPRSFAYFRWRLHIPEERRRIKTEGTYREAFRNHAPIILHFHFMFCLSQIEYYSIYSLMRILRQIFTSNGILKLSTN